MALVITLALVVLAAFAVMAFFVRATSNRAIENTRTQQVLAEQIGRTAQSHVTSLLLAEIEGNSTAVGPSPQIHLPQTPGAMVPSFAGTSAVNSSTFPTLFRQSVPGADPFASAIKSTANTPGGISLNATAWDAPRFHRGAAGFTSDDLVPNWIYVQRDGSLTNTPNQNTIGRFAYNLYEVGGLLDANMSGRNSSLSDADADQLRFSPAAADLSALGANASASNQLAQFRRGTYSGNETAMLREAARTGNLAPVVQSGGASTTRQFASRQDLLRYAATENPSLAPALPYLTHYSRHVTSPSWGPATPPGSSIDYANLANTDTALNRFLPNVRVKAAFTRADGTQAVPGEPLLKHRFPLSRLQALGPQGINAAGRTLVNGAYTTATSATVQRDFGLVWDNSRGGWLYTGPSGSVIQNSVKTLEQVADENREPNFAEILQAVILTGSLGQSPGHAFVSNHRFDTDKTRHVLAIMANIIDQYDSDDAPTLLFYRDTFNDVQYVAGIENLPYIDEIHVITTNELQNWSANNRNVLLAFELWNPHQNAVTRLHGSAVSSTPAYTGVEAVRIAGVQGSVRTELAARDWAAPSLATNPGTAFLDVNASTSGMYNRPFVQLSRPDGSLLIYGTSAGEANNIPLGGQSLNLDLSRKDWFQNPLYTSNFTTTSGTHTEARTYFNPALRLMAIGDSSRLALGKPNWRGFYAGFWSLRTPSPLIPQDPANQRRWYWATNPSNWMTGVTGNQSYHGYGDPFPTLVAVNTASPATRPVVELQYRIGGTWRPYQRFELTSPEIAAIGCFPEGSSYGAKSDPRTFRFGAGAAGNMAPTVATSPTDLGYPEIYNSGESGFHRAYSPLLPPQLPGFSAGEPLARRDTTSTDNPSGTATRYHDTTLRLGFSVNRLFQEGASGIYNPSGSTVDLTLDFNNPLAATSGLPRGASNVRSSKLLFPAEFWENTSNNFSRYTDPDKVARFGDGGLSKVAADRISANNPWNRNECRPLILNRPFRSQAELGYVFRDIPWRSLDFSSANSADLGLLDVFSIEELVSQNAFQAGLVNPNTAPKEVFAALISGSPRLERVGNHSYDLLRYSLSDALNIADHILSERASQKIFTPADLASTWLDSWVAALPGDDKIKTRREALIRALAPLVQTRTWNVFADIIAQSGSFSGSPGQFIPSGQSRTWQIVAIDRFLNKVIDSAYENVTIR